MNILSLIYIIVYFYYKEKYLKTNFFIFSFLYLGI